jgi:3-oxoacyl-[acyl-carrier protein] reductase
MIELKQERRTHVPFPADLLRDRVAIVTGGSRGIGRSTVLRLAEAGCNVVINYRQNHAAARDTARRARERSAEAITIAADISRNGEAFALAEQAVTHFGRVDILVANAGIWEGARVEEMPEALWDRVLEVNLKGTWNACRAVVPVMKRQGQGSIVIVSSTAGQRGEAHYSSYAASKGGQISFTKSLAVELAPLIRVNCVAPGWVDTELNDPVFHSDGFKQHVAGAVPLQRIAQPGDVARSIVFLASDWAQHITGEVLNVNGGAVLCG